jgi:hypothetical protein
VGRVSREKNPSTTIALSNEQMWVPGIRNEDLECAERPFPRLTNSRAAQPACFGSRNSVNEAAKIGRAIQNAVYEEVDALSDSIEQLASAKSFGEVFHNQSDYFHGRAAATTARGWAIINYVSELVLEAAKVANKKSSANAHQTQAV